MRFSLSPNKIIRICLGTTMSWWSSHDWSIRTLYGPLPLDGKKNKIHTYSEIVYTRNPRFRFLSHTHPLQPHRTHSHSWIRKRWHTEEVWSKEIPIMDDLHGKRIKVRTISPSLSLSSFLSCSTTPRPKTKPNNKKPTTETHTHRKSSQTYVITCILIKK